MTAVQATNRRVVAVAALAVGAALALTGCGAGQISQTADQRSAVNGNWAQVGNVALRDVRVLFGDKLEYTNSKGGKAALAFSAINTDPYQPSHLVNVATDVGAVRITPTDPTALTIAPGKTLVAGLTDESIQPAGSNDATNPPLRVEITSLKSDLYPGLNVPVTFTFRNDVTAKVTTAKVSVPIAASPDTPRQSSAKSGLAADTGSEQSGY